MMSETVKRKESAAIAAVGVVTLTLALLFVFLFLAIPAIYNFLISFKQYNMAGGFLASPWIGIANYKVILGDFSFHHALIRSFELSLISGAILFALSLPVGYLITATGRTCWLRHGLCTLLLIPLVIPQEIWAKLFTDLFSAEGTNSPWLLAFWSTMRYIGLPALLASAAISHGKRGWSVPILAGGLVSLVLFATLGRLDYTFMRLLSPIQEQTIDTYVYRHALSGAGFDTRAALQMIQLAIRAVLLAAAAFPVVALIKRLFPAGCKPECTRIKDRLPALAIPGGIVLVSAVILLIIALSSTIRSAEWRLYASMPVYIVIALFGAAVNTAVCFLLARPAACFGKHGKTAMNITLLLCTTLSMNAYSIGEYLIFKSLGMINTYSALALSGIGSVWGVWPLLLAAKSLGVNSNSDWIKRMWKPALALFAAQAMIQMNNTVPSLIYINNAANVHPLLVFSEFMRMSPMSNSNITLSLALLILATAAIPVVILLVIRTVMDEKESLGLFFPGK